MNEIKISTPKNSLINNIYTPPNSPSKQMLAIEDSFANIHISKQSTKTISPVIILNYVKARLPDGSTMESSQIATIQLPVLSFFFLSFGLATEVPKLTHYGMV